MSSAGTILRVNLSDSSIKKTPTAPYIKDYIGGIGIAARIFWEEVPPETRAFSPDNALIFSSGTLTGTLLGNKGEVCSKTPEQANNPFVHVGFGGQFTSEVKFAGYDQIVIQGRAKKLVYLYINNDQVEIRDARHLQGLDVHKTQKMIREELGDPDIQVACIGPAGENLVVCAMVVTDIDNSASKRGMGAVMGSKNLKAVAVRGTRGLKIADPKAFLSLFDELYFDLTQGRAAIYSRGFHREGMSRLQVEGYAYLGGKHLMPDKLPPSPTIDFLKRYGAGNTGCAFCPLQCHQIISVPEIGNGGAMCVAWFGLVYAEMYNRDDYLNWWQRTMLCERYGVDSLYVEMLGSWLMNLYKNGIITAEDTDGIPMVRGSEKAITALIEKLAKAEGFGKLLTAGIVPAAQKIGKNSLAYANQIGNATPYLAPGLGVGLPDYLGPAAKYKPGDFEVAGPLPMDGYGEVLSFAEDLGISPREAADVIDGWCDLISERITGDKSVWRIGKYDVRQNLITADQEDSNCLGDIIGHCHYLSDWYGFAGILFGCEDYSRWLGAATGTECTTAAARTVAHRVRMLIDSYRVLSARMLGEEHVISERKDSFAKNEENILFYPGSREEQKQRAADFCRLRGYDLETGWPTREALEKLGLPDVADKLYAAPGKI
jgi:aldehyde:ferredoxin oxidoreductase